MIAYITLAARVIKKKKIEFLWNLRTPLGLFIGVTSTVD